MIRPVPGAYGDLCNNVLHYCNDYRRSTLPENRPMRHEPFNWNDIPIILELGRSGNMSAAARTLGVETSTISRRLAAVEKHLQTRLLIRGAAGYQPTDAGRIFLGNAEKAVGQVRAMLLATRSEGEGEGGPVTLTAINVLFDHWLIDRIPPLLKEHPLLQLKLIAENQNLSFTRREADFALRLARPTRDAALLMRKVGELGFAVYGERRFAAIPRKEWRHQAWLAYNDELSNLPEMEWLRQLNPSLKQLVQVSSVTTLVRACEAGIGLALLPCFLGESNGLTRLSDRPELSREIWLLRHRDASNIRRFQIVAEWLSRILRQDGERLSGKSAPQ